MPTAGDLCTRALKIAGVLGVGQTAAAEDANDAFTTLVSMLNLWQSRRWLVPSLAEVIIPATGAQSYSVGLGGDVNVLRPDTIEDAFVRLLGTGVNSVDYPLAVINSREDYNTIGLKSLNSWPSAVYYSPSSPLGQLFVWPVASSQYEIHIFIKSVLANFANLTSPLTLPAEYEEAILYGLAGRLCILYGVDPRPGVVALSKAAENTIRNANGQIGQLKMPAGFLRGGRGAWVGGGAGGIFAVAGAGGALSTTMNSPGGAVVTPGTYLFTGTAAYPFTITSLDASVGSAGGSITAQVRNAGNTVGGLGAVPVTLAAKTNFLAAGANRVVASGATVDVVVSVTGSPTGAFLTLNGTKT